MGGCTERGGAIFLSREKGAVKCHLWMDGGGKGEKKREKGTGLTPFPPDVDTWKGYIKRKNSRKRKKEKKRVPSKEGTFMSTVCNRAKKGKGICHMHYHC